MKNKKYKIAIVTTTRAEYGLLRWVLKEFKNEPLIDATLFISGTHLEKKFGNTINEIISDDLIKYKTVKLPLCENTSDKLGKYCSVLLKKISTELNQSKPDYVLLLGDRFEMLACAYAACLLQIPIAHIHGGELTSGTMDDCIRHAISKLSHLHFVTCEEYRQRLIQMGEQPNNVFNVGALGVDAATQVKTVTRNEFSKKTGYQFKKQNFLITLHPELYGKINADKLCHELLNALKFFPNVNFWFTGPNADPGGDNIRNILIKFTQQNSNHVFYKESLGQTLYINAVKFADVVIGNSSSGILEVPFFKKPTVNIGNRQLGRVRAQSIIDCKSNSKDIQKAISLSLSTAFQKKIKSTKSPFGNGKAGSKIKTIFIKKLVQSKSRNDVLLKVFKDLSPKRVK